MVYVGDLIVGGSSLKVVDVFKAATSSRFPVKDLGELRWILGTEVTRGTGGSVHTSQKAYVRKVLERYGTTDCNAVSTPVVEGGLPRLAKEDGHLSNLYVSVVGSLVYAAVVSRPDIACAVQVLGRHTQASGVDHWLAAKRVLRYLKGTTKEGITYRPGPVVLVGYSGADWAGDAETRRSTTGYVFHVAGGPVAWGSRLQQSVALSSAEAEHVAVCEAVQEAVYSRSVLAGLGHKQDKPTVTYEDNQGCIALSRNPLHHRKTKHTDIRYHFTRERVEAKGVELVYLHTSQQLADLLTKPVGKARTEQLRSRLLGNA